MIYLLFHRSDHPDDLVYGEAFNRSAQKEEVEYTDYIKAAQS